jgi:hypothetical protein
MPGYEHDPRDIGGECEFHEDIQWTYDVGGPIETNMVVVLNPDSFPPNLPNSTIILSAAGDLHCLTLSLLVAGGGGFLNWNVFIGGNGAIFDSPMAISPDYATMYVCNSLGEVTAVATDSGDVFWKITLPDATCDSAGLVVDGRGQLFVPTSKGIFALSPGDGSVLWEFSTEKGVTGSPSIAQSGNLIFGTGAGKLISLTVAPNPGAAVGQTHDAFDGAEIAGMTIAGFACAFVIFFAFKRSKNGGDFPYEMSMAENDSVVEMSRSQTCITDVREV